MDFDVIIVGSGAAGVFAAKGLAGKKVLLLDVGKMPSELPAVKNLYEMRENHENVHDLMIGTQFESLHNVFHTYLNPKIKSPFNRFIIHGTKENSPTSSNGFDPFFSLAAGGMANGWGAGAYRFLDRELKNFPFHYQDLKPFYEEVTEEVGINGEADELTPSLGETTGLQPAQPLPEIGKTIFARYQKEKSFFSKNKIIIGKLRQAVLTQKRGDRDASTFDNLEFFRPHLPSIYTPAFTLKKLIQEKIISYEGGILVHSFLENKEGIQVTVTRLANGEKLQYRARKLILAAGTLNTTRLVLRSSEDTTTTLPLIENQISYIPFIDFTQIGKPVEKKAAPAFFGVLFDQPNFEDVIWCSMYGLGGPLRSEYLFDFPLSARGALRAAKELTSGMIIVQCFYPGTHAPHRVKLKDFETLDIQANPYQVKEFEKFLIKKFRKLKLFSHPALVKRPEPGNSFHYACTLPMKESPGRYETNRDGKLFGHEHVYIADAANFSALPAINHTMTIMANALRIGTKLKENLQ